MANQVYDSCALSEKGSQRCAIVLGTVIGSNLRPFVFISIMSNRKALFEIPIVKNTSRLPENAEKGLQARKGRLLPKLLHKILISFCILKLIDK